MDYLPDPTNAAQPLDSDPADAAAAEFRVNLGRPSIWNMTGSTKPVSEILSADWDEAQGYLT